MNKIHINISRKKKEKLVKWYGWIFILLICMTPLVIIVLPKLMLNVNRINTLLRESIIPEKESVNGNVNKVTWNKTYDGDLGCIEGEIEIINHENKIIKCIFKKYVGPKYNETFELNVNDNIYLTGLFKENVFLIRNMQNNGNNQVYTTEPMVSVY
ncbi:hypothetical protein [Desulforamulus hydrothermalis]|uniref:Uncharacterized protein n=1 Tax=Desulforamulus hydrothermalis Lam5 = DSM 18033 TaxID=1121428 RepID=K8E6G5_9FIRM|nr:hypothetical protein [Desulforamulus hydrothermalis]CCO07073.1 conserved hypothetical protein [Desulforamulus hydrothermalis Lam5 = DSM 18033]SHH40686.1 hypothetical protein SAMN02745177_02447 [Desulforamulus hydrothermalis Lam5 = DSM 18033]